MVNKYLNPDKTSTNITQGDVNNLMNPFSIPGLHFICRECEIDCIPYAHAEAILSQQKQVTLGDVISVLDEATNVTKTNESHEKENSSIAQKDSKPPVSDERKQKCEEENVNILKPQSEANNDNENKIQSSSKEPPQK